MGDEDTEQRIFVTWEMMWFFIKAELECELKQPYEEGNIQHISQCEFSFSK